MEPPSSWARREPPTINPAKSHAIISHDREPLPQGRDISRREETAERLQCRVRLLIAEPQEHGPDMLEGGNTRTSPKPRSNVASMCCSLRQTSTSLASGARRRLRRLARQAGVAVTDSQANDTADLVDRAIADTLLNAGTAFVVDPTDLKQTTAALLRF